MASQKIFHDTRRYVQYTKKFLTPIFPSPAPPKISDIPTLPVDVDKFSFVSNQFLLNTFSCIVTHDQRFDEPDGLFNPRFLQVGEQICGGKLNQVSLSVDQEGGGAFIRAICEKCEKKVNYHTSPKVSVPRVGEKSEVGLRSILASFLGRNTPTQQIQIMNLIGVSHYSQRVFEDLLFLL